MRLRGLPFVPVLLLAGCLIGGGAQQFRAGEKAYTQGDLPAAEKACRTRATSRSSMVGA